MLISIANITIIVHVRSTIYVHEL